MAAVKVFMMTVNSEFEVRKCKHCLRNKHNRNENENENVTRNEKLLQFRSVFFFCFILNFTRRILAVIRWPSAQVALRMTGVEIIFHQFCRHQAIQSIFSPRVHIYFHLIIGNRSQKCLSSSIWAAL